MNSFEKELHKLNDENIQLKEELEELKKYLRGKESEEIIFANIQKYKNVFHSSPLGILHYDEKGVITDCNDFFVNIIGSQKELLIGLNMIETLPDKKLVEEVKKSLSLGEGYYNEVYKSTTANKETPVRLMFKGIKNNKGEIIGGVGLVEDISERFSYEEKLKEGEQKLRLFFENAGDGIIIGDEKGFIIDINQSYCDITGFVKEEILGKHISEIFKKEILESKPLRFDVLQAGGHIITERDIIGKGNVTIPIEMNSRKLGEVNYISVIRDLRERKKKEKELQKSNEELRRAKEAIELSERRFRELFEKSGDAILILENGIFVDCNLATIEMLNYSTKSEFLNIHPSKLSPVFQPDGKKSFEKAEEMMNLAFEKGTHRFEWIHVRKNGEEFPVEVLLTAISDVPGKRILHTVWRDVTYRKVAENELIKAKEKAIESDKLKSAFLANMSHEIRTPMNAIVGFTELMDRFDYNSEKRKKFSGLVKDSCHQLNRIVNDIIDISKIEAGLITIRHSKVDVNKLINELLQLYMPIANKNGNCLNGDLTSENFILETDHTKFRQVLENLLSNANKFTDKGVITIGYEQKVNEVIFYVRDTGVGISVEQQKLIFERFRQVESANKASLKGTGLGLSISKAYIERMGGKMWIESEPEQGSTFYFSLPI